jgi:hypothetical protein
MGIGRAGRHSRLCESRMIQMPFAWFCLHVLRSLFRSGDMEYSHSVVSDYILSMDAREMFNTAIDRTTLDIL